MVFGIFFLLVLEMFTKFEFISRSIFFNGFVQEGRVEWYVLISSVRPLTVEQPLTRHWNQPKKRYSTSKDKEEVTMAWYKLYHFLNQFDKIVPFYQPIW